MGVCTCDVQETSHIACSARLGNFRIFREDRKISCADNIGEACSETKVSSSRVKVEQNIAFDDCSRWRRDKTELKGIGSQCIRNDGLIRLQLREEVRNGVCQRLCCCFCACTGDIGQRAKLWPGLDTSFQKLIE